MIIIFFCLVISTSVPKYIVVVVVTYILKLIKTRGDIIIKPFTLNSCRFDRKKIQSCQPLTKRLPITYKAYNTSFSQYKVP